MAVVMVVGVMGRGRGDGGSGTGVAIVAALVTVVKVSTDKVAAAAGEGENIGGWSERNKLGSGVFVQFLFFWKVKSVVAIHRVTIEIHRVSSSSDQKS